MRDPDDRATAGGSTLGGATGKAAERLKMFYQARGITEDTPEETITRYSSDYSAAVLAAIEAAEATGPGQANLPQWRFLGPDLMPGGQAGTETVPSRVSVSGRLSAIAVDPSDGNHLLCGSAAGGVWESITRGADWAPRTDFMPTLTIGAIAFDPVSPLTVYAGTGEGNSYWYFGQGMLWSTDGGTTWQVLANSFAGQGFFAIIVDPADTQHLLAATQGIGAVAATRTPATGGVYQSADGGQTWTQVYPAEACWDMSMSPDGGTDAEVLAATTDGPLVSADGGATWAAQPLPGMPESWDRLAVSISPADPTVAFAFGASGGKPYLCWRSGGAWQAVATPRQSDGTTEAIGTDQAFYDWYVAAAPDHPGQVYLGAKDVFRGDLSADGTTWTWTNLSTKDPGDSIHPDQHAIAFDPDDPSVIYCGCDGGLFRSPDRGVSWVSLNPGLGITELVYMVQDNLSSRWLLAGTQDNGSIRYLGTSAFEHVADGDGGDCGIDQTRTDPATPATCYHTFYNMSLERSTAGGGWQTWTDISPPVPAPLPDGYCLFYPPVGVAGSTVAMAGQSVWLSRDTGQNWTEVTLPVNPPTTMSALYLPSTDLVYAATVSGRLFKIAYSDGAWGSATELAQPRASYVSAISKDHSDRIWVTLTEVGGATVGGQVWRSDDEGQTWADKTSNLPALPLTSIAFDDANPDRVWVSADLGVWQSTDGGTTWSPFFRGLPYGIVEDLEFQQTARVLRAGTRSRGIWEAAVDQPGSSTPSSVKVCAVATNHVGGLEAFSVGTGNAPQHVFQNHANSAWYGWMPLDASTDTGTSQSVTSALAVVTDRDGRLDVLGRGPDGALWHNYTTAPDYGWSGWESPGGLLTGDPAAARNQDGRLEVVARGPDGALWHTSQTAAATDGWSAWESLGGVITTTPALALNVDGRLDVFARGNDGTLAHITQTSPGSTSWSAWESLGGNLAGNPVAWPNLDGRLEVFARGPDGALWHISQTAANGGWSAWESLGGTLAGDPAVTTSTDRGLQVFTRGTDNALWDIWQAGPGGGWSPWEPQGGTLTSDPVACRGQDGSLDVFALGNDAALWHAHQGDAGFTWESLGGTLLAFS